MNAVNDLNSVPTHATTSWTRGALTGLALDNTNQISVITAQQAHPISPDLDVWDAWPLADPSGRPVSWRGGQLWFALAVSRADDPELRHHLARIHHFHRVGDRFEHLGETLPAELSPAAREWSGTARLDQGVVTLYFTAAGRKGDTSLTYHQRLFSCRSKLSETTVFEEWSKPVEIIEADGTIYRPADENEGVPGKIKAFRDPSHFRNDDGRDFVLFTGSSAAQPGAHDGVIGLAEFKPDGSNKLLQPIIDAVGVNNELERPHIVEHGGQLYLFWSTQRGVFAPDIEAPTGLYGATASNISGPWTLMNGHGLIAANPATRPTQAYSWWVLPDLTVTSFVDYWGPEDASVPELKSRRARFGGTFAPFIRIALEGDRSWLVQD